MSTSPRFFCSDSLCHSIQRRIRSCQCKHCKYRGCHTHNLGMTLDSVGASSLRNKTPGNTCKYTPECPSLQRSVPDLSTCWDTCASCRLRRSAAWCELYPLIAVLTKSAVVYRCRYQWLSHRCLDQGLHIPIRCLLRWGSASVGSFGQRMDTCNDTRTRWSSVSHTCLQSLKFACRSCLHKRRSSPSPDSSPLLSRL